MTLEQQKLVESNINLVYSYAHKYKDKFRIEFDDLIQIASVGLCKAVMSFDESRGIKLSTYAFRVIHNEVLTTIRKPTIESSQNIAYLDADVSIGDESDDISQLSNYISDDLDIEDQIITKISVKEAICKMKPKYAKIVEYMLKHPGATQRECMHMFNVSQPSVSRAVAKFKQVYKP